MKTLVIGCNGQLGHSLADTAPENVDIIGLDLPELDITDATAVLVACRETRPDVIVNAASVPNRMKECRKTIVVNLKFIMIDAVSYLLSVYH